MTIRLDVYVKMAIEKEQNSIEKEVAQRLLDTLRILNFDIYTEIIANGVCSLNGVIYKVYVNGRIV